MLDKKILASTHNVSTSLGDLVSLTTRGLMGTMDITYGTDPSDTMIFVNGMGDVENNASRQD